MGISGTVMLYAVVGCVLAAVLAIADEQRPRPLLLLAWALLWPLFAPEVLGRATARAARGRRADSDPGAAQGSAQRGAGDASAEVDAVTARLRAALRDLDGVAADVVRPHRERIDGIVASLDGAAVRLAELEATLVTAPFDLERIDRELGELGARGYDDGEPRVQSLRGRRHTVTRLRRMRDRTREEIERAAAKLEEIASQAVLVRFAEEPASGLTELLADLGGSVDALAELTVAGD